MNLSQRLEQRRQTDLTPIREQRVAERRVPAWIARMDQNAKDLTTLQVAA